LRQFGTKQTQAELDKNLAELRDRFLTANGYNYQQDIQPWVGQEVTIAFLAPQSNTSTKSPPTATATNKQSVVIVLPIEKPAAAQTLAKPKPPKQGKWVERNYKGVQIKETQAGSQNYSTTVLDQRFLVVTDNPKATERTIDTYKGGASIGKTSGYIQALDKIKAQRFAQFYINIPLAARVAAANPSRSFSSQGLVQLQNHQGLASTVTLESEGIRFKSISWLKQNSQRLRVGEKAITMQSRLPAET
jgi:hypothetical protein